ncbi:LysE family translocator [Marinomonas transparens]|uniref:LysE family translocator n=1 Tax=Marinomonas transparens TaxID=2795388 RepID=A0A934JW04_9GAMM|nr:LysE family translocator [Marinomonas transparens]MBJ7539406.1 LysE family translocator [Marinomonas transparens]
MNHHTLFIYAAVAFFYIISPGPAVFLALYNGASRGIKAVMVSALGNIIGLFFLSLLSISGLSAILMASSSLFMAVKIIGAAYLIYLGIKQLRATRKPKPAMHSPDTIKSERGLFSYFKEGLIVAVTNPKPILFFAALFPQFLDMTQAILLQFIIMTGIFMLFSFLSLTTYGYLAQQTKTLVRNSNAGKWFQRVSGGLFILMGISLFQVKNAS